MDANQEPLSTRMFYPLFTFLALVALTVFVGMLFVQMVRPYLIPLILAAVTALTIYPLYLRVCTSLRQRRYWAAGLVSVLVILLLVLPFLGAVSAAFRELGDLLAQVKHWASQNHMDDWTRITEHPTVRRVFRFTHETLGIDVATLREKTLGILGGMADTFSKSTLTFLSDIPDFLLAITLYALGLFFFLADGKDALYQWRAISPLRRPHEDRLWAEFHEVCKSSVVGTILSAAGQAALLILTLLLIVAFTASEYGPWIWVVGAVTLVAAMLPVAGAAAVWVPLAIFDFATGQVAAGVILSVSGFFLISTVDNVIRVWALKGGADMHPFYGLVVVIGGIQMFGLIGVFLGPIIGALIITLLKLVNLDVRGREHYLRRARRLRAARLADPLAPAPLPTAEK